MRISALRVGDVFVFDFEPADCLAVKDAEISDAGHVVLTYEHRREVRMGPFDLDAECDLVQRLKIFSEPPTGNSDDV